MSVNKKRSNLQNINLKTIINKKLKVKLNI